MPHRWTSEDLDTLGRALQSAYHNLSELEQLMFFGLGEKLDNIAAPGTLPARVMAVVQWAESSDRLDELIRSAHDRRPRNPEIRAVRERLLDVGGTRRDLILFLAANPTGTARLALDAECSAIEREIRMIGGRDHLELRSKWTVTVDELMRHLAEHRPTVIHVSAHGGGSSQSEAGNRDVLSAMPDGTLVFEDEQRRPQLVTAPAFAELIRTAAPATRVVVLNACFSDAMAAPLRDVVDCVVGMRGAVADTSAQSFAVAFYRALASGRSIANAVAQSAATLHSKPLSGRDLPVCISREGVDPDRVVLVAGARS